MAVIDETPHITNAAVTMEGDGASWGPVTTFFTDLTLDPKSPHYDKAAVEQMMTAILKYAREANVRYRVQSS